MVFGFFILFRRSSGFHLPGGRLRIGGWFILHNGFLQFLPHAMGGIFKLPDTAPQRTGKLGYLFRPKKQQDDQQNYYDLSSSQSTEKKKNGLDLHIDSSFSF